MHSWFRQDKILKRFGESEKFAEMVKELGVSKKTIYFKIKLTKILEKYRKLEKFFLSLNLLKNYLKIWKIYVKKVGESSKSFFAEFRCYYCFEGYKRSNFFFWRLIIFIACSLKSSKLLSCNLYLCVHQAYFVYHPISIS